MSLNICVLLSVALLCFVFVNINAKRMEYWILNQINLLNDHFFAGKLWHNSMDCLLYIWFYDFA